MASIVTANDLRSGTVVYLGHDGAWVEAINAAKVVEDAASLRILEAAAVVAVARCEVTAVYAFKVRVKAGQPEPVSVRERIRAAHAVSV